MKRKSGLLQSMVMILLAFSGTDASGQGRVGVQIFGGLGLSSLYSQNTAADIQPRILPHAGIYTMIPLEGRFSLKTGLAYEQKGWKVHSSITDTLDKMRDEYTSAMLMHTVRIPLQLCFTYGNPRALSYSLSAGMSYVFFVQAEETWTMDTYRDNRLRHSQTIEWNPTIALIPDDSRFTSTYEGTEYYRFNTAFRVEGAVIWKARYSMQVFWERGLNSMSARIGNTARLHLGYGGISLGLNL